MPSYSNNQYIFRIAYRRVSSCVQVFRSLKSKSDLQLRINNIGILDNWLLIKSTVLKV